MQDKTKRFEDSTYCCPFCTTLKIPIKKFHQPVGVRACTQKSTLLLSMRNISARTHPTFSPSTCLLSVTWALFLLYYVCNGKPTKLTHFPAHWLYLCAKSYYTFIDLLFLKKKVSLLPTTVSHLIYFLTSTTLSSSLLKKKPCFMDDIQYNLLYSFGLGWQSWSSNQLCAPA